MAKILPALLTLLALSIYTRYLSPEEYGKYSLIMLTGNVLMIGLFQWVILGVGRYLPECSTEADRAELLNTVRLAVIVISAAVIIVFLIASLLLHNYFNFSLYLAGLTCAALALSELTLKVLNADLKPRSYGQLLLFRSVVAFCFGGLFSYLGYGSNGVISGFLIGSFLAFFLFKGCWLKGSVTSFNFAYLKKFFKYGMPLTFTYLLVLVIDVSDRFFIKHYMGIEALGQYSAPYDFTQYAIGAIAAVVHLAAFPLIVSQLNQCGYEGARSQLRFTFSILIGVMLPTTIGLVVCASDIAQVLFGRQFSADAAMIIPIVSVAMFFSILKSFYFDYAFQLSGATRDQVYAVLVAAVLNVIGNMLLIPIYGLFGAALSTVIAFLCALVISIILGMRSFPMPRIAIRPFLTVVISSVGMSAVAMFDLSSDVSINLILKVVFSILIYALLLVVANFLNLRVRLKSFVKEFLFKVFVNCGR